MLLPLLASALLASPAPDGIVPRHWLVIGAVDKTGRRPVRPDAVFARHLLRRDAPPPAKGEVLRGENGTDCAWSEFEAPEDGRVGGDASYAWTTLESDAPRVWLAKLAGASRLWVNGTPFTGDPYEYGFGGVPIALAKGANQICVAGIRGSFRLELVAPQKELFLAGWDATFGDLVVGDKDATIPGAVLVVNAGTSAAELRVNGGDGHASFADPRPLALPPLSFEKLPLDFVLRPDGGVQPGTFPVPVYLQHGPGPEPSDRASFAIDVRAKGAARRVAFRARDDDSVQVCALLPASGTRAEQRGVVLSLHGASVDCWGQISSYSQKQDFAIVAPTNRRSYGFDWQDWGRTNAYEALLAAVNEIPRALYLTGHSMGGHGTWHLAANDADRFAAIAPSAGWISFDSYGGRPAGALDTFWRGADASSDTLALLANLVQEPAYILHGAADDNVPIREAQTMEKALSAAGHPPQVHWQEGAGHWWDGDRAPGADCVDWPEIFELFRASKPRVVGTQIDFTSVDPAIDSAHGWLAVLELVQYGKPVHVTSSTRENDRALVIQTENARYLRLTYPPAPSKKLVVDGSEIALAGDGVDLLRENGRWRVLAGAYPDLPFQDEGALEARTVGAEAGWKAKTPDRSGPFKHAFTRSFVLVYGTQGSPEEQRELFERARADAQTWWYRGNGRARLLSDYEYLAQGSRSAAGIVGNVILYGNADTNLAWKERLGARAPIQVQRGRVRVGTREWSGDGLCALFVFPPTLDDPKLPELFGLVGDTGPAGTRLSSTVPYFVSGVGLPDYTVFGPEVLEKGDGGVLAAGWFDAQWQLDGHGFLAPEPKPAQK